MGVSTTHRINLSMWILIYSFSDTYYVWAACEASDVLYSVTTYMRFFPSYPHRTPSKRKIVNDLRLISLETNLAYYTEDFVLSALHKNRTDD